ncbi:MAG: carboxypeptidase regulatory-like domain-containing protein [Acidobacteria bacterium]|nr:carboxypeptidase regulatory-like domain-containing protein [Acidobacteriota bacterium]
MKRLVALLAACAALGAAPARAGSVSGRLLDASGKPAPGARVQWVAYRTEDQAIVEMSAASEPAALGETKTGPDGAFRVAVDKPDLVIGLRVFPPGSPSVRFRGPFDSTEDVSLEDIHALAGARLTGRIVDDEGKPVAGARVRAAGTEIFSDQDSSTLSEAKTGADGTFAMEAAPAGARTIVARAPGLVQVSLFQMDPKPDVKLTLKQGGTIRGVVLDPTGKAAAGAIVISEDQGAESGPDGTFRLAGVEPGVRNIQAVWKEDFAVRRDNLRVKRGQEVEVPLKLARAAAIAGTVIDEATRKPLAGARLAASSAGPAFGLRRAERRVRADAKGKFRLNGLAPRPYAVTGSREGYLASVINGVSAGTAAPGTVALALAKAASVAGKVVDEKGQPVAGANVHFALEGGMRGFLRRGPSTLMGARGAFTAADGTFRLRNLAAGRNMILEAGKPGYTDARRTGLTLKTGDALANVSLTLKKGLEARGKVVDGEGKPIPEAEVRVAVREGRGGGMGNVRQQIRMVGMDDSKPDAVSGPDGTFVVRGLEPGEYSAVVARDGYARKSASNLAVAPAADNVWPPITLVNGAAISGFVRDSQGQPIAGAQIFGFSMADGMRPQSVASDVDGRFRLDGLTADRSLFVSLTAAGFAQTQKSLTPPVQDVVIVLKTAGTIRGHVEDGDTKRPIIDFSVGRSGPRGGGFNFQAGGQGGDKAFQSEDGSFDLPDVPAGKWTVRATASGYRNGETSGVELGEGETKEGVVVSLRKGGSLSGRVLDPKKGTGVPNASVSWQAAGSSGGGPGAMFARMAGGAANTATNTDADGRFRFDGLPEGRVTLVADHPDYLETSRDVDPEKDTNVDIALGTGGAISGTVVDRDGRTPMAGALVALNEEGDAGMFGGGDSTRTDGSGVFSFEHLKAGRFKVSAQSAAGKSAPKEVILAENQRQDGVLIGMVAAGSTVRGTVSGLPRGKLGGLRVFANGKDYSDSTQTDDTGAFTLKDVPPGIVQFNVNTGMPAGRAASKSAEIPDEGGEFPVQIVFEGSSRLAGRVTRADRPLEGLFISANADPPSPGAARATSQTDEDGRFALEGLSDGTYQISVGGRGVSYRKAVSITGDTTADVVIPASTVSGTVTEEGSGAPLEGAMIQAESGKETAAVSMKTAVSDSLGHYEIDSVDPGSYQISARKAGYQQKTSTATVGADSSTANFSLAKGSGISIRISDGVMGFPLHGVTVLAFGGSGGVAFQGSVSLDSSGKGEISSLGPGRYSIYFFSDGYAPRALAAVDAPSPEVAIAMTPGGRVEVHTGVPGTGRLTDGSGAVYLLSPFRLDGRVTAVPPASTWEHLAPGRYTLQMTGGGQGVYPFTIAEGQTTRLDLK